MVSRHINERSSSPHIAHASLPPPTASPRHSFKTPLSPPKFLLPGRIWFRLPVAFFGSRSRHKLASFSASSFLCLPRTSGRLWILSPPFPVDTQPFDQPEFHQDQFDSFARAQLCCCEPDHIPRIRTLFWTTPSNPGHFTKAIPKDKGAVFSLSWTFLITTLFGFQEKRICLSSRVVPRIHFLFSLSLSRPVSSLHISSRILLLDSAASHFPPGNTPRTHLPAQPQRP